MPFHGPKEPKIQYASSRTTRRQTGDNFLGRFVYGSIKRGRNSLTADAPLIFVRLDILSRTKTKPGESRKNTSGKTLRLLIFRRRRAGAAAMPMGTGAVAFPIMVTFYRIKINADGMSTPKGAIDVNSQHAR